MKIKLLVIGDGYTGLCQLASILHVATDDIGGIYYYSRHKSHIDECVNYRDKLDNSEYVNFTNDLLDIPSDINYIVVCTEPTVKDLVGVVQHYIDEFKHLYKQSIIVIRSLLPLGAMRKDIRDQYGVKTDLYYLPLYDSDHLDDVDFKNQSMLVGVSDDGKVNKDTVYKTLSAVLGDCSNIRDVVSWESAELSKLEYDVHKLINVSYMNETLNTCKTNNIDARDILKTRKTSRHDGYMVRYLGLGYGGPIKKSMELYKQVVSRDDNLSEAVLADKVNELQKYKVFEDIYEQYKVILNNRSRTVAVVGMTYTYGASGVYESPSTDLVKMLSRDNRIKAKIEVFDPNVQRLVGLSDVSMHDSYESLKDCDLVIMTHHRFSMVIWEDLLKVGRIYDCRGCLSEYEYHLDNKGIIYKRYGCK